jgi:cytochrome c553
MTNPAPAHFSLRDLPLPAKLVVTCFLLAVGLGYTSAMVQLHFKDSRSGQPMPTVEDVVLKFTGKRKRLAGEGEHPRSQLVTLVTAAPGLPFNGTGTMAPAFTTRDGGEFSKVSRGGEAQQKKLQAERDGERDAVVLWAESPEQVRKDAYDTDHFGPKPGQEPKAITPGFRNTDGAVKIRSVIEARCARCHKKDGDDSAAGDYPLTTYAELQKYLTAPPAATGDWVKVQEGMSLDKLTQSTHAHLLSFAVLFALTGLVFAFTSYPTSVRCVLGPLALVAVVTDVVFWWLARLSDGYGVYFAMGVLGTGGLVGIGLCGQIVLSLWNMYGPKGKVVLVGVFALGAAAGALVYLNIIHPGLEEKRAKLAQVNADSGKKPDTTANNGGDTNNTKGKDGNGGAVNPPAARGGKFAEVLAFPLKGPDGKDIPVLQMPFDKRGEKRNMVRAFFDKDKAEFADAVKDKNKEDQERLTPERHGERIALTAWANAPDAERRAAFEADAFPRPPELIGKPLTKEFAAGGKVKVKTIIDARCAQCHDGHDKVDFDAKDYAKLAQWLADQPAGK